MDFDFTTVPYGRNTYLSEAHAQMPKASAVFRIFDTRDQLIILDKTSNLYERLERYFGERVERVRDLDLREIAARIEFRRTWSPLESTYLLYLQRREQFPRTYRKMRTFRLFTLLKLNRKQRFPRVYAAKDIKAGADYFGPFETRSQFTRLKTELERTFRLRPYPYNIRGNDPHPDCLYFQMHTCSRPCNNDIDRNDYLADIDAAITFIQGGDEKVTEDLRLQMADHASAERFEHAALLQKKVERIQRARKEIRDRFSSLWDFNYVVLLSSDSTTRTRVAFVRQGNIVRFEDFETAGLEDALPREAARMLAEPPPITRRDWQYDEFCLIAGYLVHPLKSVELLRADDLHAMTAHLRKRATR